MTVIIVPRKTHAMPLCQGQMVGTERTGYKPAASPSVWNTIDRRPDQQRRTAGVAIAAITAANAQRVFEGPTTYSTRRRSSRDHRQPLDRALQTQL
jgi:hypothetical protein